VAGTGAGGRPAEAAVRGVRELQGRMGGVRKGPRPLAAGAALPRPLTALGVPGPGLCWLGSKERLDLAGRGRGELQQAAKRLPMLNDTGSRIDIELGDQISPPQQLPAP
jgi:hypothetical protein